MAEVESFAAALDEAARAARPVPQLSASGELSLAGAYAIQAALIGRRLARGERLIGVKMGFTSRAKALQMGVTELILGRLTDSMLVEDGATLDLARYCHPRAEPELAFRLARPLGGEVAALEAYDAVEAVAPAIELIDSRYQDFRFSLADVVADNASSSGVVLGPWRARPADPSNLGVVMSFDGAPVQIGSTAAVLGDPVRALVSAVRMLARHGERLEPGAVIMTGGATAAEALRPGLHVRTEIEGLGRVGFHCA
jgi:2-oxo-3-hexenedioate decarboxylase